MSNGQPNNTILDVNYPSPGEVWIRLPEAGNLQVTYVYEIVPAKQVFIWHQDGTTEQVSEGVNNFVVTASDALVYVLGNSSLAIKLGWAYV